MKEKLIKAIPYILVGMVVLYLANKYDKINRGEVEIDDDVEEVVVVQPTEVMLLDKKISFEIPGEASFVSVEDKKFEGTHSAIIKKDNVFGPTFQLDSLAMIKKIKRVEFSFKHFSTLPLKTVVLVLSISNDKGNVVYHTLGIPQAFKFNDWSDALAKFDVDNSLLQNESKLDFRVYVMNEKGEEFYMDNMEVKLFGKN